MVDIETRSFKSLRNDPGETAAPLAPVLEQHLPGMRLVSEYNKPGLYWSELAIFRKTA